MKSYSKPEIEVITLISSETIGNDINISGDNDTWGDAE